MRRRGHDRCRRRAARFPSSRSPGHAAHRRDRAGDEPRGAARRGARVLLRDAARARPRRRRLGAGGDHRPCEGLVRDRHRDHRHRRSSRGSSRRAHRRACSARSPSAPRRRARSRRRSPASRSRSSCPTSPLEDEEDAADEERALGDAESRSARPPRLTGLAAAAPWPPSRRADSSRSSSAPTPSRRSGMSDPAVYNDHREAAEVGRRLKELEGAVQARAGVAAGARRPRGRARRRRARRDGRPTTRPRSRGSRRS